MMITVIQKAHLLNWEDLYLFIYFLTSAVILVTSFTQLMLSDDRQTNTS